jgi:curved DNA-binding protein CbpA
MTATQLPDYYETLQVSPRADRETVERVFRHLAKRYHPDNRDSGNTDMFGRIVEAYRVLTNPEERARYDISYEQLKAAQWRIFDQETTQSEIAADARIRNAILALLYVARRNDCANPAIGAVELERTLSCPESLMAFHIWYLREQGLIKRNESGGFAITAAGVDRVLEHGGPEKPNTHLISAGEPMEGQLASDLRTSPRQSPNGAPAARG